MQQKPMLSDLFGFFTVGYPEFRGSNHGHKMRLRIGKNGKAESICDNGKENNCTATIVLHGGNPKEG